MKTQRADLPARFAITITIGIVMMPPNLILKKCTSKYKLHKYQEKLTSSFNMGGFTLFAQSEKELQTLIQTVTIYSQDTEIYN